MASSSIRSPLRRLGIVSYVLVLGAALTGCRTYNERVAVPLAAFERGNFSQAQKAFADPSTTGSDFLSGAEAGMAAFVGGDFDAALLQFQSALAAAKSVEERAVLGLSAMRELIATAALNEGQSDYKLSLIHI